MASLVVVLIILGCAAYQYFKGTVVKAFATIIIAIFASIVAFSYFEALANIIISRGSSGRLHSVVPWSQPLCFGLLFILTFAILQTIAAQLTRTPVDLGLLPERIGRIICGIFLGLILSGLLLTTLAMAPLPNKYPYQRFDETNPAVQRPNKVLLNADGITAGWFNLVSKGSFRAIRNPRSFAVLHPAFMDQMFLNRHNESDDIPLLTSAKSIDVERKNSVWFAPAGDFKDADGNPITPKSGHSLVIIPVGIRKNAIKDAGKFNLAQLRLICKQKAYAKGTLEGKGINVYPIGYFSGKSQIQTKKLSEPITVVRDDFDSQETRKHIDFVFNVPNDHTPVLLEFKLNNIVEVPSPVSADQAPPVAPFIASSTSKTGTQKPTNPQNRPGTTPNRQRGLSNLGKSLTGLDSDEDQ
jgi:hypothetical protein